MANPSIPQIKVMDSAVEKVTKQLHTLLATKGVHLPDSLYPRIRYHPQWSEPNVIVVVKLAQSDSPDETNQTTLMSVVYDEHGELQVM